MAVAALEKDEMHVEAAAVVAKVANVSMGSYGQFPESGVVQATFGWMRAVAVAPKVQMLPQRY